MDSTALVDETAIVKIDWWIYVLIVCSVFSIALALNYIVKKINDARLEQRIRELHNKPSTAQFQVEAEPRPLTITPPDNYVPEQEKDHKKLSLIFNKEREVIEDAKSAEKVLVGERRKEVEVIEDAYNTISISDRSGSSYEEYIDSVSVSGRNSPHSTNSIGKKPAYLGKIYKDLNNESKINIKGILISKEVSKSKESLPITTVNQIKIDRSRESIKVEHNKANIDKVEQSKAKTGKIEQKRNNEEQFKTHSNDKVKGSKASDKDSIINESMENTVLNIQDSKSDTKI